MSTALFEAARKSIRESCDLAGMPVPEYTDAEIQAAMDEEQAAALAGPALDRMLMGARELAVKHVMTEQLNRLDALEARCMALEARCSDLAARQHTITVHQPAIKVEAPNVTVAAPEVTVKAPNVTVETPPMETVIEYDGEGKDKRMKRTIQRKAK